MKKLLAKIALVATLVAPLAVPLSTQAATTWDTTGSYVSEFYLGGTYAHDMNLVQDSSGNITGIGGGYPAGGSYSYAWTIDSGTVVGNTINFTAHYTLGAVGTTMHVSGTIAPNGSISGVWDDNFGGTRNGTWATVSGAAKTLSSSPSSKDQCKKDGWKGFNNPKFKNQGDCVSFVEHLPKVVAPELLCFDGTTDGGYGGTCAISNGVATLNNSSSSVTGDYSGVYYAISTYSGQLLSSISSLGYTYSGTVTPSAGNLSLNIPVDENNDGTTDNYAYVDATYCSGVSGVVDVIHDSSCAFYYAGGIYYANWSAFITANPTFKVSSGVPFIVAERTPAEPAVVWTVSNVNLGQ